MANQTLEHSFVVIEDPDSQDHPDRPRAGQIDKQSTEGFKVVDTKQLASSKELPNQDNHQPNQKQKMTSPVPEMPVVVVSVPDTQKPAQPDYLNPIVLKPNIHPGGQNAQTDKWNPYDTGKRINDKPAPVQTPTSENPKKPTDTSTSEKKEAPTVQGSNSKSGDLSNSAGSLENNYGFVQIPPAKPPVQLPAQVKAGSGYLISFSIVGMPTTAESKLPVAITEMKEVKSMMVSHVLYTIKYTLASGEVSECPRRYSQFDTFHKLLEISVPNCLLPALPPKSQSAEVRKECLESYLNKLLSHPLLKNNSELNEFLVKKSYDKKEGVIEDFKKKIADRYDTTVKGVATYCLQIHNMVRQTESYSEQNSIDADTKKFVADLTVFLNDFKDKLKKTVELRDLIKGKLQSSHNKHPEHDYLVIRNSDLPKQLDEYIIRDLTETVEDIDYALKRYKGFELNMKHALASSSPEQHKKMMAIFTEGFNSNIAYLKDSCTIIERIVKFNMKQISLQSLHSEREKFTKP